MDENKNRWLASLPTALGIGLGVGGMIYTLLDRLHVSGIWSIGAYLATVVASLAYSVRQDIIDAERGRLHWAIDDGGDSLKRHIKAARETILLTAFTPEEPDPKYLGALLSKIKADHVTVRRVVSGDWDWLNQFKHAGPRYTECKSDQAMPFNLVIIDNRIVWLFLPMHPQALEFHRGMWVESETLARHFTTICDKLCQRVEAENASVRQVESHYKSAPTKTLPDSNSVFEVSECINAPDVQINRAQAG